MNRDQTLAKLSDRERTLPRPHARPRPKAKPSSIPTLLASTIRGRTRPTARINSTETGRGGGGEHFYRQDHPLAVTLIERASPNSSVATVRFDYDAYGAVVSSLIPYRGKSGGWNCPS